MFRIVSPMSRVVHLFYFLFFSSKRRDRKNYFVRKQKNVLGFFLCTYVICIVLLRRVFPASFARSPFYDRFIFYVLLSLSFLFSFYNR